MQSIRRRLVDGSDSLGERSRQRRWQAFAALFPDVASLSVVDLGGTSRYWARAPVRPRRLVVVNVADDVPALHGTEVVQVRADACGPLDELDGEEFDLVFSNSLVEHVGGYVNRRRLADNVRRLAPRYWIQTPYRYFPVEPHWLFPGLQFLPLAARARIIQRWPLGHTRSGQYGRALSAAASTELLGKSEMRHLFPGSTLVRDRVGPFTKSLVAVQTGTAAGTRGNNPTTVSLAALTHRSAAPAVGGRHYPGTSESSQSASS